ncbi:MAG TPA: nitrite reductase small subunit NirD [Cellulomonas sp.]|uniref:nitrite reductase small subunit NirD n=1 Tax=Cellulomonas sp. TaxID=40001 RepID=UPI002E32A753|nr:nitrite reductase small subunit NirD [Cellulomonas sp.]HEX5331729.1 nitrite reductase small subunit NirD [Cellulomonas sp.]
MTAPAELDAGTVRWTAVCRLDDLAPERGAAALVGGEQVALVRLHDDRVLAVQQLDPFSGAHVMSRGIVGSRSIDGTDVPTLTAPMYKQVFDLETGRCLDGAGKAPLDLRTWDVVVTDGVVQVGGAR